MTTIFKICPGCDMPFTATRKDQQTCGDVCRQRYKRAKKDKVIKFAFVFSIEEVQAINDLLLTCNNESLKRRFRLTIDHNNAPKENQKL